MTAPPAGWASSKTATGVDLDAVADTDAGREAACEALPGTNANSYVPADATQNTLASWSSGQVHLATAPLEEEVAAQKAQIASLTAATTAAAIAGNADVAALRAEVADLRLALRSLKVTLPATIPSRATVATQRARADARRAGQPDAADAHQDQRDLGEEAAPAFADPQQPAASRSTPPATGRSR